MSGIPVVVVERFGLPVKAVEGRAPVMTVSPYGMGIPIVLSEWGAPFIVEGLVPPLNPPGPINDLSVLSTTTSTIALAFTDAARATSHEYQLDGGGWVPLDPSKVIDSLPPDTSFDVQVRGVNAEGNGPPSNTVQAQTLPIPIPVPVNTVAPEITGTEQVGETLTATTGTWTNSPDSYAYQWQRNTGSWADISGATGSTYDLVEADEGATIRVQVIATNGGGDSDPAYSSATGTIQPIEPPIEADFYMMDGGTGDGLTPETAGDFATVWAAAPADSVIALVGNTTITKGHTFTKNMEFACARGPSDVDPLGTGHTHIARFQRQYDLIAVPPNDPDVETITSLWRFADGVTIKFTNVRCTFPYWPGEGQTWANIGVAEGSGWFGPGGLSGNSSKAIFDGAEIFHGYGPTQALYDPTLEYPDYTAPYNTAWRAPYVIGGRITGQFINGAYVHDVSEISKIIAQADSQNIFDKFWFERVIGDFIRVQWDTGVVSVDEPLQISRGIMLDGMGLETDSGNPHSDWTQLYMQRVADEANRSIMRRIISANVMVGVTHPNSRGLAQTHFWQTSQDHQVTRFAILIGAQVRNFVAIGSSYKAFSQNGMRDTYIRDSIFVNPDWWDSPDAPTHKADIALDRIYPTTGEPRVTFDDSDSLVWNTIAEGIGGNATYTSNMIDTGYKGSIIDHDTIFDDPSTPAGSIKPGLLYEKYRPIGSAVGYGPSYSTLNDLVTADIDFTGEKPWIGLIPMQEQEPDTQVTSNRFYLFGGDLGDTVAITLPSGVEMQQYPAGEDTVLEAWTNTPTAIVGNDAQLRVTTPASGSVIHEITYGGDTFEWFVGAGNPGAPDEFLISTGGWFADTGNVGVEAETLRFKGKFRFTASSAGALFALSGGRFLLDKTTAGKFRATVRDSDNTLLLNSVTFDVATVADGVWCEIDVTASFLTDTVTLTVDGGTPEAEALSDHGTGKFPSNRYLLVGATINTGTNALPAGTEIADLEIYVDGVLHKSISNTATTANADGWKLPASPTNDFTQGTS